MPEVTEVEVKIKAEKNPSTSGQRTNERAFLLGRVHHAMNMPWGKAKAEAKKFGYTSLRACIFADAAAA